MRNKGDWAAAATACCRDGRALATLLEALTHPSTVPETSAAERHLQQRAGFVLLHVHRRCPKVLDAHLAPLLDLLDDEGLLAGAAFAKTHASVPRQVFSVFQDRALKEELAGQVFAKAVDYFLSARQAIAVRARALDCAANVARQYPDLWPEVRTLAESIDTRSSAGLLSTRRRLLSER